MKDIELGKKLQILRRKMGLSQKEFAELLNIPQPTMSAYENDRISPTMEVMISVAQKCNVSLDWLCGLSPSYNITTMGDISDFLYKLMELNEIGLEIEVHDHLPNDFETETEKWYTRITVFGNDRRYEYNADLCNIIRQVKENITDLETYAVSKEIYDMAKEKTKEYHASPVTRKQFPELSREERMKKHIEFLNTLEKK